MKTAELIKKAKSESTLNKETHSIYVFTKEELTELLKETAREQREVDSPWPLKDVLVKLIHAANILLHATDYDGHGYEEIEESVKRAKEIVLKLDTPLVTED